MPQLKTLPPLLNIVTTFFLPRRCTFQKLATLRVVFTRLAIHPRSPFYHTRGTEIKLFARIQCAAEVVALHACGAKALIVGVDHVGEILFLVLATFSVEGRYGESGVFAGLYLAGYEGGADGGGSGEREREERGDEKA